MGEAAKSLLVAAVVVTGYGIGLGVLRLCWIVVHRWRRGRRAVVPPGTGEWRNGDHVVDLTAVTGRERRRGARWAALAELTVWVVDIAVIWAIVNAGREVWPQWTIVVFTVLGTVAIVSIRRRLAVSRLGMRARLPRSALHLQALVAAVLTLVGIIGVAGVIVAMLLLLGVFAVGNVVADAAPSEGVIDLVERTGYFFFGGGGSTLFTLVSFGITVLGLGTARRLGRTWRGAARAPAADVLRADPRPPILLLRSFEDDRASVPTSSPWGRPLLDIVWPVMADELESVLARVATRHGPPIAVSWPSKQLGRGSARDRAPTEDWMDHVLDRARAARLVVAVCGSSPGLRLEMEAIGSRPEMRGKSLVLMPPEADEIDRETLRLFGAGVDVEPGVVSRSPPRTLVGVASGRAFVDGRLDEYSYAAVVAEMVRIADDCDEPVPASSLPEEPIGSGIWVGFDDRANPWLIRGVVRFTDRMSYGMPTQVFVDGVRKGEFTYEQPADVRLPPGEYDIQLQQREIFRTGPNRWAKPITEPKRERKTGALRVDVRVTVHPGGSTRVLPSSLFEIRVEEPEIPDADPGARRGRLAPWRRRRR